MPTRPVLYVLAGVNGAGKSSIGGHLLTRAGLAWFNPDRFARELRQTTDLGLTEANAAAWHLDAVVVTDAFMLFAIGLIVTQRIEMYIRARRILMGGTDSYVEVAA